MRIVAVGKRAFVSGFMLAGAEGIVAESPNEALSVIERLVEAGNVGLILVSTDVSEPIRPQLSSIKAKRPVPLIYEVPPPGEKREVKIEYRSMLREMLGI